MLLYLLDQYIIWPGPWTKHKCILPDQIIRIILMLFLQPVWKMVSKVVSTHARTHAHARARTHTHTHTHIPLINFKRYIPNKTPWTTWPNYTGCPRRNGQNFGRVFLMLKYTDITQNTYIQSWMVAEIMAREVWKYDSCYTLTDYQIHIKTGRNMWFL